MHGLPPAQMHVCISKCGRRLTSTVTVALLLRMQHPLVIEMRRCMIPRLRKYLLHPDKVVRSFAAATCFSLGCLTQDMMSQLGTAGPKSIQVRHWSS